jgi:hypothetical protein
MNQVCFGVESCPDGSVVIAAGPRGGVSVTRLAPTSLGSVASQVVEFVRSRAPAPRVCVASSKGADAKRGLDLALALGTLPESEVILMRSDLVSPSAVASVPGDQRLAVALATCARRAA